MPRKMNGPDPARVFQALGDATRLRLLNLMRGQEVCVCYFTAVLREPQPKISRHLAYLRLAGIVSSRRDGKWIHYHIETPSHPGCASVLNTALSWIADDAAMQRDSARFSAMCSAPSRYPGVCGAPVPSPVQDGCCSGACA